MLGVPFPALSGFGSLFTVCLPWVTGLHLRKSKTSLSGAWAIRKGAPAVYSPHGVLLNGSVFQEWVCLLIINIPHLDCYMDSVRALSSWARRCLCGCTPVFGFLFLSLTRIFLFHLQLLLFHMGLFHFCSKSSPLPPWANCSSFTLDAIVLILCLVTPTFS